MANAAKKGRKYTGSVRRVSPGHLFPTLPRDWSPEKSFCSSPVSQNCKMKNWVVLGTDHYLKHTANIFLLIKTSYYYSTSVYDKLEV